jgi:hypothetical protein
MNQNGRDEVDLKASPYLVKCVDGPYKIQIRSGCIKFTSAEHNGPIRLSGAQSLNAFRDGPVCFPEITKGNKRNPFRQVCGQAIGIDFHDEVIRLARRVHANQCQHTNSPVCNHSFAVRVSIKPKIKQYVCDFTS